MPDCRRSAERSTVTRDAFRTIRGLPHPDDRAIASRTAKTRASCGIRGLAFAMRVPASGIRFPVDCAAKGQSASLSAVRTHDTGFGPDRPKPVSYQRPKMLTHQAVETPLMCDAKPKAWQKLETGTKVVFNDRWYHAVSD
jgi:hypothetical protein